MEGHRSGDSACRLVESEDEAAKLQQASQGDVAAASELNAQNDAEVPSEDRGDENIEKEVKSKKKDKEKEKKNLKDYLQKSQNKENSSRDVRAAAKQHMDPKKKSGT